MICWLLGVWFLVVVESTQVYDEIFQRDCEVQVIHKLFRYMFTISLCGTWHTSMGTANDTLSGNCPISLLL